VQQKTTFWKKVEPKNNLLSAKQVEKVEPKQHFFYQRRKWKSAAKTHFCQRNM